MIFQEISKRSELNIKFKCSYLEIYNEILFDLLSTKSTEDLHIQDDALQGISIKGLTYQTCVNEEEALNCLFEGETNRTVGSHILNEKSSRSHCV